MDIQDPGNLTFAGEIRLIRTGIDEVGDILFELFVHGYAGPPLNPAEFLFDQNICFHKIIHHMLQLVYNIIKKGKMQAKKMNFYQKYYMGSVELGSRQSKLLGLHLTPENSVCPGF